MNFRTIVNLILASFISATLAAQDNSEVRNIIKTLPAGKDKTLEVNNKYGAIYITTWEKDSVYIKTEIKAFAPNITKLDRMFRDINVNIMETKYIIRAETDFNQSVNMFFESLKEITSQFISYDSRMEINYYIQIPIYMDLKIENKYGDVFMEDNEGNSSVTVSNGSFRANSLGDGTSLILAFCDATISSIPNGHIDASFSDIFIDNADELNITSISSKYDIGEVLSLILESRRDKIYVRNLAGIQGDTYFSDIRINNISKELILTTKYGDVTAGNIESGFDLIDINSDYSEISFEFDENASYNADIRHLNAYLVLPDGIISEQKTINEEKKEYLIYGTVGKKQTVSKVKIDATRGRIYLK